MENFAQGILKNKMKIVYGKPYNHLLEKPIALSFVELQKIFLKYFQKIHVKIFGEIKSLFVEIL